MKLIILLMIVGISSLVYSETITIQNEVTSISIEDKANMTLELSPFRLNYLRDKLNIYISPLFDTSLGLVSADSFKLTNPTAKFGAIIDKKTKLKWAFNFSGIPIAVANNINKIAFEIKYPKEFNVENDVVVDGDKIYFPPLTVMDFSDLKEAGFIIKIINQTYVEVTGVKSKTNIFLDPEIIVYQNLGGKMVYDTWLDSFLNGYNYGSYTTLYVDPNVNAQAKILIAFNISEIPADANVTNAKLILFQVVLQNTNRNYSMDRVMANWSEGDRAGTSPINNPCGATWNYTCINFTMSETWFDKAFHQNRCSIEGSCDVYLSPIASLQTPISVTGNFRVIFENDTLTDLVRQYVNGTASWKKGVLINTTDNTTAESAEFAQFSSAENSVFFRRPRLEVTFTANLTINTTSSTSTAPNSPITVLANFKNSGLAGNGSEIYGGKYLLNQIQYSRRTVFRFGAFVAANKSNDFYTAGRDGVANESMFIAQNGTVLDDDTDMGGDSTDAGAIDINQDGIDEMVRGAYGGTATAGPASVIYKNGTIGWSTVVQAGQSDCGIILIEDFDMDGIKDIGVGCSGNFSVYNASASRQLKYSFAFGNSSGRRPFEAKLAYLSGSNTPELAIAWGNTTGSGYYGISVFNATKGGSLPIYYHTLTGLSKAALTVDAIDVSKSGSLNAWIYANNLGGTTSTVYAFNRTSEIIKTLTLTGLTYDLVVGDFNNDGKISEFAVWNGTYVSVNGFNTDNSTTKLWDFAHPFFLANRSGYAGTGVQNNILAADIDNDNLTEVVVASSVSGWVFILNGATGALKASYELPNSELFMEGLNIDKLAKHPILDVSRNATDNATLIGFGSAGGFPANGWLYAYEIEPCKISLPSGMPLRAMNWNATNNAWYYYNYTGLPAGDYNYTVYCDGNFSRYGVKNITSNLTKVDYGADTTKPNVTNAAINSYTPFQLLAPNRNLTLKVNATVVDNVAVNIVLIEMTFPNGTKMNFTTANTGSEYYNGSINLTIIGNYSFKFFANDTVGNANLTTSAYTLNNTLNLTLVGESTNPTWSSNSTSGSYASSLVGHTVKLIDETALSGYIFSFDNGTGTFVNESWVALNGILWRKITVNENTIPTIGATIRWRVYFNDTSNNWNVTSIFSYLTTARLQWSLHSINSTIAGTSVRHSVRWDGNRDLSGFVFSFDNGTGTFVNDSWASMKGVANYSNATKVINLTVGAIIRWRVFANDSGNNWNATDIFSYTTSSRNATLAGYWLIRSGEKNSIGETYCRRHGSFTGNGHDTGCLWRGGSNGMGEVDNSQFKDDIYCSQWFEAHFDEDANYTTHNISRLYCHFWATASAADVNNINYGWGMTGKYGDFANLYDSRNSTNEPKINESAHYMLFIYDNASFNYQVNGSENVWNTTFFYRPFVNSRSPQLISYSNQKSFCIVYTEPTTNATLATMDSDGDNLTDFDEMFVYFTDPYDNNTDDSFADDYNEVVLGFKGYDPYDSQFTTTYHIGTANNKGYYLTSTNLDNEPVQSDFNSTLNMEYSSAEYAILRERDLGYIFLTGSGTTNKWGMAQTNFEFKINQSLNDIAAINIFLDDAIGDPDEFNVEFETENESSQSFSGFEIAYRNLWFERKDSDFSNLLTGNDDTIRFRSWGKIKSTSTTQVLRFAEVMVTRIPAGLEIISPTTASPLTVEYPQNISIDFSQTYVTTGITVVNITFSNMTSTVNCTLLGNASYISLNRWRQNCSIANLTVDSYYNLTLITDLAGSKNNDTEINAIYYSPTATISFTVFTLGGGGNFTTSMTTANGNSTEAYYYNATGLYSQLIKPCANPNAVTYCQNGMNTPQYSVINTGNTQFKFYMKLKQALAVNNVKLCANSSGSGGTTNTLAACTFGAGASDEGNLNGTSWLFLGDVPASARLNITTYMNFSYVLKGEWSNNIYMNTTT